MAADIDSVIAALIERHGTTFADELSINLARNTPSPLFRLLTVAQLLAANIDARLGVRAARALSKAGYRTAQSMAEATDEQRWKVLAEARYLRKQRTAKMLGECARAVVGDYGGDLRRLWDAADHDADQARSLLCEFAGIGEVGADIFLREVQVAWTDLYPYVDARVRDPARRLKLPVTAQDLAARTSGPQQFAALGAALIRCDLAGDDDAIRAAAR